MRSYPTYLFLSLAVLLGGGCQDTDVPGSQQLQVPIELRAVAPGLSAQTKATGTPFETTVFCSTRKGNYASLGQEAVGKWKAYEWHQDTQVDEAGNVGLTDKIYPVYGDNVYVVAVAPQIADTDADGTLSYTLTGKEDLMYASEIEGNRWDVSRLGSLTYAHLLTQLVFKAKKKDARGLDVTIRKITAQSQPIAVSLPLATGQAQFTGSADVSLTPPDGGVRVTLSTETTDVGCLYLPPLPSKGEAQITIETSIGTFSNVSVTMGSQIAEENFQAGVSHVITLEIYDKALGISSVEVSDWNPTYVEGSLDLID